MTTTKSGFAAINGNKSYYEITGTGYPLVMLHAFVADHRMWDDQIESFAQHYQVIRYDARGFGQTPMIAGEFSYRDDLYKLLQFLGVTKAHFMGCSNGGKTIIDFALDHPDMVSALIPVCAGVSGYRWQGEMLPQVERLEETIQAADKQGDLQRVNALEIQLWVDGVFRTPDQVDPTVRARVLEMNWIALQPPEGLGQEQGLTPPAADRLSEIHAPTLAIVGALDMPDILGNAQKLCADIAGARQAIIQNAAHIANMEHPAEFNQLVLDFLGQIG